MSSQVMVDKSFQTLCFFAFTGFLILFAQALHGIYKKRKKRQAKADRLPVALPAVTSGDGPQKPDKTPGAPYAQPPGPAEKGPDDASTKLLDDKKDALLSELRTLRGRDTTPEIASVISAYLCASEDLLELKRPQPGRGDPSAWKTDAELNAAADVLVRETTDAVKSLQAKVDRKNSAPDPVEVVVLVGLLSTAAVLFAMYHADAAQEKVVPRGQHIDLTRFTLRGESRAAGACACAGALLAPAIQATLRVIAQISNYTSKGTSVVFALVLYPADAAFRCLASTLLLLGLPLSIKAVGALSMLCILAMAIFAGVCSAGNECEGELDVAEEKEEDMAR